jgi:micrococcal nuclease
MRAVIAQALALALLAAPAWAQPRCRAVDGDTLACGSARVRVVGLDAPELRGRCPAEVALARRAQARLEALVAARTTPESREP